MNEYRKSIGPHPWPHVGDTGNLFKRYHCLGSMLRDSGFVGLGSGSGIGIFFFFLSFSFSRAAPAAFGGSRLGVQSEL